MEIAPGVHITIDYQKQELIVQADLEHRSLPPLPLVREDAKTLVAVGDPWDPDDGVRIRCPKTGRIFKIRLFVVNETSNDAEADRKLTEENTWLPRNSNR